MAPLASYQAVIASEAKQSPGDRFVAVAPRNGDDPVLDISGATFLSWLGQAGAYLSILVYAIAALVIASCTFVYAKELASGCENPGLGQAVSKAELTPALSKAVEVLNAPADVEPSRDDMIQRPFRFDLSARDRRGNTLNHPNSRRNYYAALAFSREGWNIGKEGVRRESKFESIRHISGRQMASIRQFDIAGYEFVTFVSHFGVRTDATRYGGNDGALDSAAIAPLTPGEDREENSGDCENDRGGTNNRSFVPICKSADANNYRRVPGEEDAAISGALLCGLALVGIFVVALAWDKTRH